MFNETIRRLTLAPSCAQLLRTCRLVLEPAWTGYADPRLLQYTSFDVPVFVLAQQRMTMSLFAGLVGPWCRFGWVHVTR
jgi:hypothetical protein